MATPKKLIHYTSFESGVQILESRKLWFTHAQYLTDKSELRFGLSILKARIEQLASQLNDADKKMDIVQLLIKTHQKLFPAQVVDLELYEMTGLRNQSAQYARFLSIVTEDVTVNGRDIYVLSLSKSENNLDMWRAYAQTGHGISLVFNTSAIFTFVDYVDQETSKVYQRSCEIQKVLYGKQSVARYFDRILGKYCLDVAKVKKREVRVELFWKTVLKLTTAVICSKHQSYYSENEYRAFILARYLWHKPNYRIKNSVLVPYVAVEIKQELRSTWVASVMLGPASIVSADDLAFRSFLASNDYSGELLSKSDIPFFG